MISTHCLVTFATLSSLKRWQFDKLCVALKVSNQLIYHLFDQSFRVTYNLIWQWQLKCFSFSTNFESLSLGWLTFNLFLLYCASMEKLIHMKTYLTFMQVNEITRALRGTAITSTLFIQPSFMIFYIQIHACNQVKCTLTIILPFLYFFIYWIKVGLHRLLSYFFFWLINAKTLVIQIQIKFQFSNLSLLPPFFFL